MNKKTIGIIGGMGPLATADLFRKIVLNTKADSDSDHIRILVDNNTEIPDRTTAIINGGKSPFPQLLKSAVSLWNMGAQILAMPCNTAHYYHQKLQECVDIPILNMIDITKNALVEKGIKKAALLATEGTISGGVYQKIFENSPIRLIAPDKCDQKKISELIYSGVKAGKTDYDTYGVKCVIEKMLSDGAQCLILGCTELPVAMEMYKLEYPFCDPTLELAKGAICACNATLI